MGKYYVDSFAYDYDMFMPHEKETANVVELDRKSKNTSTKSRTRKSFFTAGAVVRVAFLFVIMGLIVGNIYLRVQVTEVTAEISKAKKTYNSLVSENVNLEMQLENSVSYKNLEDSAKSLGMQKAEPYQIHYINSVDADKVEISDGNVLVTAKNAKE